MVVDQLADQAKRIIFASMYRAECHVAAGRFFGNFHLVLGALAAGLAAGASATAFASEEIIAGSLAIAAAGVTALLTSLRPDERSQLHWNAANAFAELANKTYMNFFFGPTPEPADQTRTGDQPGISPSRGVPPEPQPLRQQSPSPGQTVSSPESPRDKLVSLQGEYHRLDTVGPPLPRRLSRKGKEAVSEHLTWHPPQYEEFNSWWEKILKAPEKPRRWFRR